MYALRIDRGQPLRSPREDERGFLRIDGHATRVGILEYPDSKYPGGVRRELRLPEDVFAPASLASFQGAPITDDHPPEMITPGNVGKYSRGVVLEQARRDGDHVAFTGHIADGNLIGKAKLGKRELSPGYRVQLDETAGVHPLYGRYDVKQTDIIVNHLAIVEAGRAGPTARIRMDAASLSSCAVEITAQDRIECNDARRDQQSPPPKGNMTTTDAALKTENERLKAELASAATLLTAEKLRADAAESKLGGEKTRADEAEGKVGVLTASVEQLRGERRDDSLIAAKDAEIKTLIERADKAEKAMLDVPKRIEEQVKKRVDLERSAAVVMGPEFKMDSLTDREVMLSVLEKRGYPVGSDRTDDSIRGSFQVVVANFKAHDEQLQRISADARREQARADVAAGIVNGQAVSRASARQQMVDRNRGIKTV